MAISGSRFERLDQKFVAWASRKPLLKRILLSRWVALPGYWFATLCGLIWGTILSLGRIRIIDGMLVAKSCPRWAFGRGGTTIGAIFLTHDALSHQVIEHEKVHRSQWKRYGLAFIPLYVAAGQDGRLNRFEVEAGLKLGGYE